MKKLLTTIMICLAAAFTLAAQTQQGYVKTPGRLSNNGTVIAGNRISGATVQVKGRTAVVSKADGTFSFPIPEKKFFLQSVTKKGYILTDPEAAKRQYTYSDNPLILVMDTPDHQLEVKLENEKKIRRTLQHQLQAKEDELVAQKEENRITKEEYNKKLQQLYAEQEINEKLISDMAERYSQIDFDQLDEINLRISNCILNGRLTEADSLLRSKGDINTRIAELNQHHKANVEGRENLEKSEAMEKKNRDEIAQDCYNFSQKFQIEHQNDSAAHYLELCVTLDSTNLEWLNHAGYFFESIFANYSLAMKYYQCGMRQAILQFGEQNDWQASFYERIGSVYFNQGNYPTSIENHLNALKIRESLYGTDNAKVAASYNNLGVAYDTQGDYEKALEYFYKALDIWELFGTDNSDVATTYSNIGSVYLSIGDFPQALEYIQKAVNICERVLGTEHLYAAATYNNLGTLYTEIGDYENALLYSQQALNIHEHLLHKDHPSIASSYNNIGMIYHDQGDDIKGLEYYFKALDIRERVLDPMHPDVETTYSNIAEAYIHLEDYSHALKYYKKDLEILKHLLGEDDPNVARVYHNIGFLCYNQGNQAQALEYFQKALDIREKVLGQNHLDVADSYQNLATFYDYQDNYSKAVEYYKKSIEIRETLLGRNHIDVLSSYAHFSEFLFKHGDYPKSIQYLQIVYDVFLKAFGPENENSQFIKRQIEQIQEVMQESQ